MPKKIFKQGSRKVTAGLTLGAVALGSYLYGTKDGIKKRKQIKNWMLKTKGELLEKIENFKNIGEKEYRNALERVLKKYKNLKDDYAPELKTFSKEMASAWKKIKKTKK